MNSVEGLLGCAAGHLARYVDPAGRRAFRAYDILGDPKRLLPVDFLAPALLNASVAGAHVVEMHRPDGPYLCLRDAMQTLLEDEEAATARFEEQELTALTGPWSLVRAALVASDFTPHVKASKVTKILHRKRPALVPIFDSRVAGFYGVTPRVPSELWPLLKAELVAHGDWLRDLAMPYRTPDGRELTALRVLDIIVWEHSGHCP